MRILEGLLQPLPKKALFMVSTGESTERKGIGCVVKHDGNYYVLTCRDVTSPEDHEHNFILDRFCSRFPKHKDGHRQEIQDIRYNDKFSFLLPPDSKGLSSHFPLSAEDEKNLHKVYSYYLCDDGKGAEPVDWLYNNVSRKYTINRDDLDGKNFLGSPVLYSDKKDKTFVVGVVGKKDNTYYPMFLESASLIIPVVPNKVEIVEYPSEITEDRVTLTWRAPKENGEEITGYTVYQRGVNENGSGSSWDGKSIGPGVLRHEVIGLESGKVYEFQVTATNRYGERERGEDAKVKVKVLGVPNQVELEDVPREITEDRVILKWRAPKDNGAEITKYTVYQREVNDDYSDSTWEGTSTGPHDLQHEAIDLEKGKMYKFQVTATNRCGESAKGENALIGVKVLGVPNKVEIEEVPSEITEDKVILKWRAPEDNGSAITKYTVYQREVNEDGAGSSWEGKPTVPEVLQLEVDGLKSGKMYEFQVTATNQCGDSSRAEERPYLVQIACVSPESLLEFFLFKMVMFFKNIIWYLRNGTEE